MEKEVVIASFGNPAPQKQHTVHMSRLKTMDYDLLMRSKMSQPGQTVSYQTLYVNQLNFCMSQAMIDQLNESFTISKTFPQVAREAKKNDWVLVNEALKSPYRSINEKIIAYCSDSRSYRLRFPFHFEEALKYVTIVFNSGLTSPYGGMPLFVGRRYLSHLRSLCNHTNPHEVYRLYEIDSDERSASRIKLWEFLALQFAFGDGDVMTSSISEFVARFQFFDKFSSEAAKLGIDHFKKIRTALLHRKVEVVTGEIALALERANTHWWCFSHEAKAITSQNHPNPQVAFKRIINKYIEHRESKDERLTRRLLPFLKENMKLPVPRCDHMYPKFTSLSNAIVHVYKHQSEIHDYFDSDLEFPLENPESYAKAAVGAYSQMINEVISQATSYSWGPGQFGGLSINFSKERYRAIVSVQPEGFSYLLTCH